MYKSFALFGPYDKALSILTWNGLNSENKLYVLTIFYWMFSYFSFKKKNKNKQEMHTNSTAYIMKYSQSFQWAVLHNI